jgi:hypothetical protein
MRREDHDDGDGERQTRGLMALALVLLLGLAASYLVRELREEGKIEDCLLAQRTNCDALLDDR